jgi:hypothetical protein
MYCSSMLLLLLLLTDVIYNAEYNVEVSTAHVFTPFDQLHHFVIPGKNQVKKALLLSLSVTKYVCYYTCHSREETR